MRSFIFGVLSVVAAPLWSDVLPAPTTVAACGIGVTSVTDPSQCSFAGGSASVALLPVVNLQAGASSSGENTIGGAARVRYGFEVVGGQPGDVVPVDILVDLRTAASINGLDATFGGTLASGFADITVSNRHSGSVGKCASSARFPTDTCGIASFHGLIAIDALSGDTSNLVELSVDAGTGVDTFGDELSAFASADPLIFIDPAFAGASQYSILLSPDVGNGLPSTVPEPKMFVPLAGVLLAAAGYRQRRLSRTKNHAPALP